MSCWARDRGMRGVAAAHGCNHGQVRHALWGVCHCASGWGIGPLCNRELESFGARARDGEAPHAPVSGGIDSLRLVDTNMVERSRVLLQTFAAYDDRWDLFEV